MADPSPPPLPPQPCARALAPPTCRPLLLGTLGAARGPAPKAEQACPAPASPLGPGPRAASRFITRLQRQTEALCLNGLEDAAVANRQTFSPALGKEGRPSPPRGGPK